MRARAVTIALVLAGCAAPRQPVRVAQAQAAPAAPAPTAAPAAPAPTAAPAAPAPDAITAEPADIAAREPDVPADPLRAFARQWPKLGETIERDQLEAVLWHSQPCQDGARGMDGSAPPITSTTPMVVSPDGKILVAVAPLSLTPAQAKVLGLANRDERDSQFALVFEGATGKVWAMPLTVFLMCSPNGAGIQWSPDSRRAYLGSDSGRGERIALLDVAARGLTMTAFAGFEQASPGVAHVAWMPWNSGWPAVDQDGNPEPVDGDILHIDEFDVWGSMSKRAAKIWNINWQSDAELTFCGSTPKLIAHHYRAVLTGKRVRVTRAADDSCPADDEP
jgi:hypothetical protein